MSVMEVCSSKLWAHIGHPLKWNKSQQSFIRFEFIEWFNLGSFSRSTVLIKPALWHKILLTCLMCPERADGSFQLVLASFSWPNVLCCWFQWYNYHITIYNPEIRDRFAEATYAMDDLHRIEVRGRGWGCPVGPSQRPGDPGDSEAKGKLPSGTAKHGGGFVRCEGAGSRSRLCGYARVYESLYERVVL